MVEYLWYFKMSLCNPLYGDFQRITITMEVAEVLAEYLNEALHTDGKRPLTAKEEENIEQILSYMKGMFETANEQSGLD